MVNLLGYVLMAATQPGPAPSEAPSHYQIRLQASDGHLDVSGSAGFPPLTRGASSFDFSLSPLIEVPGFTLRCGRRRLGVAAITSVLLGGDRKWTITSATPCSVGEILRLDFAYRLEGLHAPQMNISDTWSFAGGGGELWYPQRSFGERQTSQIDIDVPTAFNAIATGALVSERLSGGRRHVRYISTTPAKLAFAFGPYRTAAQSSGGGVTVFSGATDQEARALVHSLAPVISALTRVFGAAPLRHLSLVQVPFNGRVAGTSEYGMIFARAERMRGPFDAPYWAHEFGHQWWGNAVRPASGTPGATLLTEGMAQYGALIAVEVTQGAAAGAALRRGTFTGNPSQSIETYRSIVRSGRDRALATFLPHGQDEILLAHELATSKGAMVLRYLSSLVGEARFHQLLKSFIAAKASGPTSWAELEEWINQGTDNDYGWFIEQWLHQPGAPELAVSYCISGDAIRGTVRQGHRPYRLLIPIEISGPWGHRQVIATADGEHSVFAFAAPGTIDRVNVDPAALVPTLSSTVTPGSSCPSM